MSPRHKNTIEILERRKTMIDALIRFIKKHPKTAADANVKGLDGGKNGLSFPNYALIVPYWNGGNIQLRLLKSGEDWQLGLDTEAYENLDRLVAEDVSDLPDQEVERLLNEMYQEANGEEEEEDESDSK
jgi:hypothetical protein